MSGDGRGANAYRVTVPAGCGANIVYFSGDDVKRSRKSPSRSFDDVNGDGADPVY